MVAKHRLGGDPTGQRPELWKVRPCRRVRLRGKVKDKREEGTRFPPTKEGNTGVFLISYSNAYFYVVCSNFRIAIFSTSWKR